MINLKVSNFGPIISGDVDLKPLTIYVGPNNSGKSYISMLTYALFHQGDFFPPYYLPALSRRRHRPAQRFLGAEPGQVESLEEIFDDWIRKRDTETFVNVAMRELPSEVVTELTNTLKEQADYFVSSLEREIVRCFGTEISSLSRMGAKPKGFELSIGQGNPNWHLMASVKRKKLDLRDWTSNLDDMYFDFSEPDAPRIHRRGLALHSEDIFFLIDYLFDQVSSVFYQEFPNNVYYLPAARSGILQSHKLLASAIVSRAPLAGIETFEIPRLSGVVADFISGLLRLDSEVRTEFYDVAEFLEQELARGRIYQEPTQQVGYPEIYYETQKEKFLLHRTSSMVSELAPLILFLKHQVEPGDMLIIEEPESHLHPANQRKLARAIVKMIGKGLNIVVTTHSDYFLTQLSNFIRLSELPDERIKQGYSEDDFLPPEKVGCYIVDWVEEKRGSVIRSLPIDAENGINDSEFGDVAESLYEEVVSLQTIPEA